jgi:hypothetical protein
MINMIFLRFITYAFNNINTYEFVVQHRTVPDEFPEGRVLRVIDLARMNSNDTTYEAFVFLKSMANLVRDRLWGGEGITYRGRICVYMAKCLGPGSQSRKSNDLEAG